MRGLLWQGGLGPAACQNLKQRGRDYCIDDRQLKELRPYGEKLFPTSSITQVACARRAEGDPQCPFPDHNDTEDFPLACSCEERACPNTPIEETRFEGKARMGLAG